LFLGLFVTVQVLRVAAVVLAVALLKFWGFL